MMKYAVIKKENYQILSIYSSLESARYCKNYHGSDYKVVKIELNY